jgi:hypothetical protein
MVTRRRERSLLWQGSPPLGPRYSRSLSFRQRQRILVCREGKGKGKGRGRGSVVLLRPKILSKPQLPTKAEDPGTWRGGTSGERGEEGERRREEGVGALSYTRPEKGDKLRRLEKLFQRADIDGNGTLDTQELQFLIISAFRSTFFFSTRDIQIIIY